MAYYNQNVEDDYAADTESTGQHQWNNGQNMFSNTYLYTDEASTVVPQEHNNRRIMNPTHFQLNDESFNQRRTVSEVGNPGGILSTVRRAIDQRWQLQQQIGPRTNIIDPNGSGRDLYVNSRSHSK